MSNTRKNTHQEGSFERVNRAKGPDVWVYRWRELQADGKRVQKKKTIGSVEKYPKLSDAKRSVENLRAEVNAQQQHVGKMTVKELWSHYQANELHHTEVGRSPTTVNSTWTTLRRTSLRVEAMCSLLTLSPLR
jgi:integrase